MTNALEGKTLYFHEDGCVLKVLVLANTSDHEWARFKLRQLEVIAAGPYVQDPNGHEFEVSHKSGGIYGGMWTLRPEPNGSSVVAPYVQGPVRHKEI